MKTHVIWAWLVLAGLLTGSGISRAATYNVDCGTSGSSTAVQSVLDSIGTSPNNTINVSGVCAGDLTITRADRLTISGLTLNGGLNLDSTTLVSLTNLRLASGFGLLISNSRRTSVSSAIVVGEVDVSGGSSVSFSNLSASQFSDSSGTHDPQINCVSQSECSFTNLILSGSGTAAGTGAAGLLAGSGARLNLYSGTITGFDVGMQIWNNATGFIMTGCDNIAISNNLTTGIYVADGGVVKIEGTFPADAGGCGQVPWVYLSSNGKYGVLADGGGNAYLARTVITGSGFDGVRVQQGSVARVRSSTLYASATTNRSATVTHQAHLYFDEQKNGPGAASTLTGPVCVTDGSTVDTSNSSTVITTQSSCGSP